jgi:hypothetical protein
MRSDSTRPDVNGGRWKRINEIGGAFTPPRCDLIVMDRVPRSAARTIRSSLNVYVHRMAERKRNGRNAQILHRVPMAREAQSVTNAGQTARRGISTASITRNLDDAAFSPVIVHSMRQGIDHTGGKRPIGIRLQILHPSDHISGSFGPNRAIPSGDSKTSKQPRTTDSGMRFGRHRHFKPNRRKSGSC